MARHRLTRWAALGAWAALGVAPALAQGPSLDPPPIRVTSVVEEGTPVVMLPGATPAAADRPYPINLPTALKLANARSLDVALASERVRVAQAQLERARVLWLPNIYLGADYARHDGQIQDVGGTVFTTSKGSLLVGGGPTMVFAVSDALYSPLAARQDVRAREAAVQAARNDNTFAVAEAYFNVQQARGELAGAEDAHKKAEELLRKTTELAKDLAAPVDVARARADLARRRQAVESARERWRTASADLARLLRLEPTVLVEPLEAPHLQVTLVPPEQSVDDLVILGLTNRPELASQRALVDATLARLRQERLRPLIPSVAIRGASANPSGQLMGGYFGGGHNDTLTNFGGRIDVDVQVLWELQNLGLGNRARVNERKAENQVALLELFRTQDRVAAEVAQAYAQVTSARGRLAEAEEGVKAAADSAQKHLEGLGQTQRAGNVLILVIRPQEATAAIGALAQAYGDYYGAVADYDRAQFRLYRALGQPADVLCGVPEVPSVPPSPK